MDNSESKLYNKAYLLSVFTIIYNLIEGLVSVAIGIQDETLALFGFGVDSFIEVISGIGIAIMIQRIKRNPHSNKGKYEYTALRVTGTAFYILSVGLLVGVIVNIATNHTPETTFWGVIISLLSIAVMTWLMLEKRNTGVKLCSQPIISDSNCTKVCLYMSVVLLVSSLVYELTGFAYADVIGALGLIYFSVSEGTEAFEKARGKECTCTTDSCKV